MKSNIIVNIPHSSCSVPDFFEKKLMIDKNQFLQELKFMADIYTDDLFENEKCNVLKAKFSRLFCDIERFRNDKDESMSKLGMGAVYTKTADGKQLIEVDDEYKKFVLESYYDAYHDSFNQMTQEILDKYKRCVIIDGHSFSKDLLEKLGIKSTNIPDFCIGFDEEFCDSDIVECLREHFTNFGYSVDFNNPYSGSIVPSKYYFSHDKRVKSVMVEVNKRIYLNDKGEKNSEYFRVKKVIQEAINKIIFLEESKVGREKIR